ncbi:hypothetical protein ACGFKZ_29545 [Micromonospora tulbaghiae]|uniref:hypothetical protein n=1 Tax=Micromonospora tulbaghiae TaxID=479978 RepID=UPI0037147699
MSETASGGRQRKPRRRTGPELVAALDRGDWLLPSEVAELLGVHRDTVRRMHLSGVLRYRNRAGAGRRPARESHPADVRAEKLRQEEVHRQDPS